MKKYPPLSASLLLCTTAAFAQDTGFQGGELTLNAGVNAGSISITGAPDTIDMFGYSLGATYIVPSAALGNNEVTVFASYGSTNFSGLGMDQDVEHVKLGATIAFGGPSSSDLFSRVSLF